MPILFVTGTDTGCGKTHTSAALLQALNASGQTAVGFKPVASGCEVTSEGLRNEDALILQRYSASGFTYDEINPIALEPAIAPHLAAADVGRLIDLDEIVEGAQALARKADWVIVEGAGGFMVPLNAQQGFADLARRTQWPCLLVVGMRLGCINHALLSAQAIRQQTQLLAWVANVLPPVQERWQDNLECLDGRMSAVRLACLANESIEDAANRLDLSVLQQIIK